MDMTSIGVLEKRAGEKAHRRLGKRLIGAWGKGS
jgi:hypothetical protein